MARQQRFALVLSVCLQLASSSSDSDAPLPSTQSKCGSVKGMYRKEACCGNADKLTNSQVVPMPQGPTLVTKGENICVGKKPSASFPDMDCMKDQIVDVLEQAGSNVTVGYTGTINTTGRGPITSTYWEAGLCPVNVHWHLGTEHLSVGQYDENGKAPTGEKFESHYRHGFSCHHYDSNDVKFTTEYDWQYCVNMHVGETYEIHWPHSAAGACGTPNQYQSPFYDGVFCRDGIISLDPLNTFNKIGVQSQTFTVVNDEKYYYPDLMRGMIVDAEMGQDIAKYTGSTTGTNRNNTICSTYTPITWQVDRKCHLISASSFDKLCADMLAQRDDMSSDSYAHGARELVPDHLAADNHQRL